MSEWQRGCTVGGKSPRKKGTNNRDFERERDRPHHERMGYGRGQDSRPCHAYQRGDCRYGSDCRYSHQKPNMSSSETTVDRVGKSSEPAVVSQPDTDEKNVNETTPSNKKLKCPPALFRSRDFLFKGISLNQRKSIVMDKVASFSVTESQMADKMTDKILEFAQQLKPSDNVIFDGMACVGGNTISFAQSFNSVLANEFDEARHDMLKHNVIEVLNIRNVTFFNGSIIDLAMTCEYDILFLDPEWGGPDYKFKKQLRLAISDVAVEELVTSVMSACPRVHTIALKLPINYDNDFLQRVAEGQGMSYNLFSNFHKMTLTVLQRRL